MKVAFNDNAFAFEFVRNLGFMYYGGCDLGEMMATSARIKEGDFESWYTEWNRLAERVLARADTSKTAGHLVSAREGYLRASTYFRTAEFYLHGDPSDPRILRTARASQKAYAIAAEMSGPTWEPVEIPYEGTTLPGYFYKVDDSGQPRPTIVYHGGYDSSVEEMYFFFAAAAVRRGYNCLTFDGPGQGMPVREAKLYFRPDWEKVVTPAIDFALSRSDVDESNLVLLGMSLGGVLAARAAAFEHRFRAAIFFDGVYDLFDSLRGMLPKEAMAAYEAGDRTKAEKTICAAMESNSSLRWSMEQGLWSYGLSTLPDFLDSAKLYTVRDVADRISCPCLVMEAERDMFFAGQPQQVYDALKAPRKLIRFTAEDGAENHCQSGALAYMHQVVFDWLDEELASNVQR